MRKLEIKNIPYNLYHKLKQLVDEHNCQIKEEVWRNKYNEYIVYSSKPLCPEEFNLSVKLENLSFSRLKFVEYLFNKMRMNINTLETLYNEDTVCET